jgi:hypothetical protein
MENVTGPYRGAPAAKKGDLEALAREAITPEIGPAERLVWAGRPRQGLLVGAGGALLTLLGLLVMGLTLYAEASLVEHDLPLELGLVGLPFFAAGLYLAAGRLAYDRWRRGRLYYAVTDQRALILRDGGARKLRSIDLDRPDDIVVEEESDGSGTIVFGAPMIDPLAGDQISMMEIRQNLLTRDRLDPNRPQKPVSYSFEQLPDARAVYERIREVQREIRKTRAASVIRA